MEVVIIKKSIIAIVLLGGLFFSYQLFSQAREYDHTVNTQTNPEYIGSIGEYAIYKDTSVQYFLQVLEKIYDDEFQSYFLPKESSFIYTLRNGEETIGLKEALNEGKIDIGNLQKLITIIVKEEEIDLDKYVELGKVGDYTLYKDTNQQYFAQALEKIYEDETNVYYLREISSHIYKLSNNHETIGLKEALQEGKITIEELQKVLPKIVVSVK